MKRSSFSEAMKTSDFAHELNTSHNALVAAAWLAALVLYDRRLLLHSFVALIVRQRIRFGPPDHR